MGNLIKATIIKGAIVALAFSTGVVVNANAEVTRLSGADRYSTADAIVESGWSAGAATAVLASGLDANTVDALTVAPLAKAKNAPIVLINPTDSAAKIVAKLTALNTKTVYIANGAGVISKNVETALASAGMNLIRLGGVTRYETALKIAKEMGTVKNIVVASGDDAHLVDSLSIASIAAAKGMPIFLTSSSLDTTAAAYINSLGVNKTYVLGGTGAVSDAAVSSLPGVIRLSGAGRYETNAKVVDFFKTDAALNINNVFIASGEDANLIDALAGAPLAASKGSPIIFVHDTINPSVNTLLKSMIDGTTQITELGGTGAVTAAATDAINTIQNSTVQETSTGKVTSVNAMNGKLIVTVDHISQFPPQVGEFFITQKINDEPATIVVPTAFNINSDTNMSFTIPTVDSASVDQNVVYSVAYRATNPISSVVVKVPASAVLTVQSVSSINDTKNIGDAYTLPATAAVTLSDGTTRNLAVTWDKAADTKAAGVFTFTGTLAIIPGIVNSNNVNAIAKLTVADNIAPIVKVDIVSLNKTTDSLAVGETDTLTAIIRPDNAANKDVIWTSSDPTVATVDNTGKVTAVSNGIATITATTVDGNLTAACTILTNTKYFKSLSDVPQPAGIDFLGSYNSDLTVVTYDCYSFQLDFDAYVKLLKNYGWIYSKTEYPGFSTAYYFVKGKYEIVISVETGGYNHTTISGKVH